MKYGKISESNNINFAIYQCFEYLSENDQRKFVKKFNEQPHESNEIMHTFRELVLGAFLNSQNLDARYEYEVENKNPDWCIFNNSSVEGIIELLNLHIDATTEITIAKQQSSKGIAVYWRDENRNNIERLYFGIEEKIQKYHTLVNKHGLFYIISVFPTFELEIDIEEVRDCLYDDNSGLFNLYESISGLLYFEENAGIYSFIYENNPRSQRTISIPNGRLSLRP